MIKKLISFSFGILVSGLVHAGSFIPYIPSTSTHIIDIKLNGAKGDCVTNDAPAFQAAFDAGSNIAGALLLLPDTTGCYLISSRLVASSSVTVMGASRGGAIIKAAANLNDRLIVNSGYALTQPWTYNLAFKNVTFDMNGANNTASTALSFQRNSYLTFENCAFIHPYDSLMVITGTAEQKWNHHVYIDKCLFDGTGQQQATDVFDIGAGTDMVITNSYFFNSKGGNQGMLEPSSISHLVITNCYFDGNGNGTPVEMKGIQGGEFSGNEVKNSAGEGVGFWAWHESAPPSIGRDFSISNNNISGSAGPGILFTAPGITTDTIKNIVVRGNSIHDNNNAGIKVQVARGLTISENFLYNNSKALGNNWYALDFNGPFTSTDITDVRVFGNTFFDDQVSPTQTLGYNVNNVSTATFHNNFYHNIGTKITNTNSKNIQFLDQNNEGVNSFVGTFTRDNTLTTGNVAYTGVGFQPSGAIFFTTVPSTTTYSWGFDDGVHSNAIAHMATTVSDTFSTGSSIATEPNSSNTQVGHVVSWDPDGFTISWTKTGSPTGTARVMYEVFR